MRSSMESSRSLSSLVASIGAMVAPVVSRRRFDLKRILAFFLWHAGFLFLDVAHAVIETICNAGADEVGPTADDSVEMFLNLLEQV